ncbi:MAG: AMP-binding protein [Phycisphaerae bacterium]|nr:AMP-binding protein [Phycisphaerae bacterium]
MTSLQTPAGRSTAAHSSARNLVRCVREHATSRAGKTAFVHLVDDDPHETTMTYAELDRRARAIAAYLQDRGLVGERVVLSYPPGLEFVAAYFGALYAGCVAVPTCQPRHRTLDQFRALAADADAAIALGTAASIAQFRAFADRTVTIPWIATDELVDAEADAGSRMTLRLTRSR